MIAASVGEPLVTCRDLRVTHRGRDRTFRLEVPVFDLAPGDGVALVAPSGRGKSTLIDTLALAARPDGAERFRVGGADVLGPWRRGEADTLARLRARLFGYVTQSGALLPTLTVRQNVALAQDLARRPDPTLLADLCDRLGITALLGERPPTLSIGERQRVAIARAVAHRPRVVFADEPTAALDPTNKAVAMALLIEATAAQGAALVVASHDLDTLDRFDLPRVEPEITAEGRETRAVFQWPGALR